MRTNVSRSFTCKPVLTHTSAADPISNDIGEPCCASEGMLDGSVMIFKVANLSYYNATGTIGDQRYA